MIINIVEDIKDGFLVTFSQSISPVEIFLSLFVSILSAIIITVIYQKTYVGVSYPKSFSLSIVLLAMITSLVIKTVNSNLSLSLGMVGALSIVRFRTAVKDPIDTIFMFWAISVGIMAGAGLYLTTVIATLMIALAYFFYFSYQKKKSQRVLLVVKTYTNSAEKIIEMMKKKKATVKTESYKDKVAELTFECADRSQAEDVLKLKDAEGIVSLHLVDLDS